MNQQGDYIRPDLQPGQWAIFWDSQTPDRFIIARYSHSERTTPFDRHWTQGGEYFAECEPAPQFSEPVHERLRKDLSAARQLCDYINKKP
jgi:hypothetical protein